LWNQASAASAFALVFALNVLIFAVDLSAFALVFALNVLIAAVDASAFAVVSP
jgi:hypothetical protein